LQLFSSAPRLRSSFPWRHSAQALGAIGVLAVVYRLEEPFSLRAIDWDKARKLVGSGRRIFSTPVLLTALSSVDQFVMGSVMSVASVAHYSVPMSLVQRSHAIPMALGRTLFPRMSSLSGDVAHALGTRALAILAYGFAAICAPGDHPLVDFLSLLDQR
jgi:O-antigen/teichoic acid export membrane protein